jgi:fungal STAND N-terminal Goodbye domain
MSSSNIQLILDALTEYANQTGIDLTKNPFTEKLQKCDSAEAISNLLQERAKEFKEYRDGNRKLINCLSPVVEVLHVFSGAVGEALVLVSHSGSIRF